MPSLRGGAPTPYREANEVLLALLSKARAALGDQFVGMYLYGSLATGDFDPDRSDLDVVIVVDGEISDERVRLLDAIHEQLSASNLKLARKLEGTYIPTHALRRHELDTALSPCFNEGRFYLGYHESDWVIQRYVLRSQGAVVEGPRLEGLIDPVSIAEVQRAVAGYLEEWWAPMLDAPGRLQEVEYRAYAVLSMCRALYTLRTGGVPSKAVAARWARNHYEARWPGLIDWALRWRPGDEADHNEDTVELVRFTVEEGRRWTSSFKSDLSL